MSKRNIAPILLLTLTSAVAVAAPGAAPGGPHRPTLISGTVTASAGLTQVGESGAEWILPGGSSLVALPGSELRLLASPMDLDLGGKRKVPGYTVQLKSGLVRARVPEGARSAVVVAAPKQTSVLVARGETSVVAGSQLAVANATGKAWVLVPGKSARVLEPGMLEELGDTAGKRRPLLRSPRAVSGARVLCSTGDEVSLGEFTWDSVEGASDYRLELRKVPSDELVFRTETAAPRLTSGSARLPIGSYRLRVVSLDSTGMESGNPLEQGLEVVRIALPAGGFLESSGVVRLPVGADLTLSSADRVETTYGDAAFQAAPRALTLVRGEPRLVRLRVSGSADSVPLWLMPRAARANVEFEASRSPRRADAPLAIRVRVEDTRGAPADWIDARARVTVGVDPIEVAFSRDGNAYKGVLPALPGAGPWVVRVQISDQHGNELGRDFIELEALPQKPAPKRKGS